MEKKKAKLPKESIKSINGKTLLIDALIKGENSKRIENFNARIHLAMLHKKYL